jgi:hypothetical protein
MIGYPWPNGTEYSSLLQNVQRYIEYISFSAITLFRYTARPNRHKTVGIEFKATRTAVIGEQQWQIILILSASAIS